VQQEGEEIQLSPSTLKLITDCSHAYYLKKVERCVPDLSAAAWFGRLAHSVIQRAYQVHSLEESHEEVWEAACSPVHQELKAWHALHADYTLARGEGDARSAAAKTWMREHADYATLVERIASYQATVLSHLSWAKDTPLTEYYRRSAQLCDIDPRRVLLLPPDATPLLIEGLWHGSGGGSSPAKDLAPEDEEEVTIEVEDEEKEGLGYALLAGTFGVRHPVRMVGVPDYVGLAESGEVLVADLKTSKNPLTLGELRADMQLAIYVELLRQNGIIDMAQTVRVGHIYVNKSGVAQLWAETELHPQVLVAVGQLCDRAVDEIVRGRELGVDGGGFPQVFGLGHPVLSPCRMCDFKRYCSAYQGKGAC
jgi:hypothetical protein